MGIDRRTFLKGLGIMGTTAGGLLVPGRGRSTTLPETKEFMAVLVDTTRCVGCRSCELACAEAHKLPLPDLGDSKVFDHKRDTSEIQWTVVNRYQTEKGEVFAKRQCMHCNSPACVAACLVKAMEKLPEGPVVWKDNCMGCRFCMVSCPFDIPKIDYHSAYPTIQKCFLCWERLKKGEKPACVEACPQEALTFGTRREMIKEANRRIYREEGKYYPHIYGEHEVGGTSYLYISAVPFEQIGFRNDLGTRAYPEYSAGFLYSVPIVLLLWPTFLLGVHTLTKRKEEIKKGGER